MRVYLVDGSNSIYALFGPIQGKSPEWDQQARHFIASAQNWAAGQPRMELEIFFDGAFRRLFKPSNAGNTRIIFSDYEKADALILERIHSSGFFNKHPTVVTWDSHLADACRRDGARVIGPDEFWNWIRRY